MGASGVVLDTTGNILTMVRAGDSAIALCVVFADGTRLPARVVGSDWLTGVSVVRLSRPPAGINAARFGDSDLVEAGDWALALGRSEGADLVAAAGIVEGRVAPRTISPVSLPRGRGYLRVGARTVDGDRGGALVNLDGEVVGISTGRGLAIPINQVRRAAQMIVTDGRTHYPYMGVALRDLDALDRGERARLGLRAPVRGALVSRIWEGAPAQRAGLRAGDVITAVDNQETPAIEDVVRRIALHTVGEILTVAFVRGGSERSAKVALGDLPPAGGEHGEGETRPPPDPVLATVSRSRWGAHCCHQPEAFDLRTISVISGGAPRRIGGPQ
jgi:S1-C subfamily serine protease